MAKQIQIVKSTVKRDKPDVDTRTPSGKPLPF
jgi:hypothetical protein